MSRRIKPGFGIGFGASRAKIGLRIGFPISGVLPDRRQIICELRRQPNIRVRSFGFRSTYRKPAKIAGSPLLMTLVGNCVSSELRDTWQSVRNEFAWNRGRLIFSGFWENLILFLGD